MCHGHLQKGKFKVTTDEEEVTEKPKKKRGKQSEATYTLEGEGETSKTAAAKKATKSRRGSSAKDDTDTDMTLMMVLVPTDEEQLAYGAQLASGGDADEEDPSAYDDDEDGAAADEFLEEEEDLDDDVGEQYRDDDDDDDWQEEEDEEEEEEYTDYIELPAPELEPPPPPPPPPMFAVRVDTTTRTSMQRLAPQNGKALFRVVVVEERVATIVRLPDSNSSAGAAPQHTNRLPHTFTSASGEKLSGTIVGADTQKKNSKQEDVVDEAAEASGSSPPPPPPVANTGTGTAARAQLPETQVFVVSVRKNGVPILRTSGMVAVHLPPGRATRTLDILPRPSAATTTTTKQASHRAIRAPTTRSRVLGQPVISLGGQAPPLVFQGGDVPPQLVADYVAATPQSARHVEAARKLETVVRDAAANRNNNNNSYHHPWYFEPRQRRHRRYRRWGEEARAGPWTLPDPDQAARRRRDEFFKLKSKNLGKLWARRREEATSPDRPLLLPSAPRPPHLTPAQAQLVIAAERRTRMARARAHNASAHAAYWRQNAPCALDPRPPRLLMGVTHPLPAPQPASAYCARAARRAGPPLEYAEVASMADAFTSARAWAAAIDERVLTLARVTHGHAPWQDEYTDDTAWQVTVRRWRGARAAPHHWAPAPRSAGAPPPPSELDLRVWETLQRRSGQRWEGDLGPRVTYRRPLDPVQEEAHERARVGSKRKLKCLVYAVDEILAEHLHHLKMLVRVAAGGAEEAEQRRVEARGLARALVGKLAAVLLFHEEEMRKAKVLAERLERAARVEPGEFGVCAGRARAEVERVTDKWKRLKKELRQVQAVVAADADAAAVAAAAESEDDGAVEDGEEGVGVKLVEMSEMSDHHVSIQIVPRRARRVHVQITAADVEPTHLISVRLKLDEDEDDDYEEEEEEEEEEEDDDETSGDQLEEALREIRRAERNREAEATFMCHLRVLEARRRQAYKLGESRTRAALARALRAETDAKWRRAAVECQLYDRYVRRVCAEAREDNQRRMTDWLLANERRQEAAVNAVNYIVQAYQWTADEATAWVMARSRGVAAGAAGDGDGDYDRSNDNLMFDIRDEYVLADPAGEVVPELCAFGALDALLDEARRPSYLALTDAATEAAAPAAGGSSVAGSDREATAAAAEEELDTYDDDAQRPGVLDDEQVEALVLEKVYDAGDALDPDLAITLPAAPAASTDGPPCSVRSGASSSADHQAPATTTTPAATDPQLLPLLAPPSIHSTYFDRRAQLVYALRAPDGRVVGSAIVVERNLALTAMHTLMDRDGGVVTRKVAVGGAKVREKASFADLDLTFLHLVTPSSSKEPQLGLAVPSTGSVCPVLPDSMHRLLGQRVLLVSHPQLRWPQFRGTAAASSTRPASAAATRAAAAAAESTPTDCTVVAGVVSKILNDNAVLATYKCLPSCAGGAVFLASSGELIGINTSM